MYVELRIMRSNGGKDRSKANYISGLQHKGLINSYINESGYICYDTEELEKYQASVHRGRPYGVNAIRINTNGTK